VPGGWEFGAVLSRAVLGSALGAGAGAALRLLLRNLRRGVVLRVGWLETAGASTTAAGLVLAWSAPTLGLVLFAGLLLVALSGVDIVHHRLPDAITLPALPLAAVAVLATNLVHPGSGSLLRAGSCAVVLWSLFAAASRMSAAAMGGGDVKLVPTLGLLMGYVSAGAVVIGLAMAFALSALVVLVGLAVRRLRLNSAIPLGPYLLLGCWSVLLVPALAR